MRTFILLAAFGLAASVPLFSQELYVNEFQRFMSDHNITYPMEEMMQRLSIFMDNFDFIETHNKKAEGESDLRLGVNQFAAMTQEEYSQMLGYKGRSDDYEFQYDSELEFQAEAAPASVDWEAKGAVTPVKNQGQCGSCWAFSTTGAMEGRIFTKHGVLTSLSEQDLVDCAGTTGNNGCNGGLMDRAFLYTETKGLATEKAYPYTARKAWFCKSYTAAPYTKASGYKDVPQGNQQALKAAVAEGPVSIAIEADQRVFQMYKSGVLKKSDGCGTRLDHGVLIAGYGTLNGTPYWKVKNSWGPSWGNKGYIYLERSDSTSDLGVCGVAASASYPTIA